MAARQRRSILAAGFGFCSPGFTARAEYRVKTAVRAILPGEHLHCQGLPSKFAHHLPLLVLAGGEVGGLLPHDCYDLSVARPSKSAPRRCLSLTLLQNTAAFWNYRNVALWSEKSAQENPGSRPGRLPGIQNAIRSRI